MEVMRERRESESESTSNHAKLSTSAPQTLHVARHSQASQDPQHKPFRQPQRTHKQGPTHHTHKTSQEDTITQSKPQHRAARRPLIRRHQMPLRLGRRAVPSGRRAVPSRRRDAWRRGDGGLGLLLLQNVVPLREGCRRQAAAIHARDELFHRRRRIHRE